MRGVSHFFDIARADAFLNVGQPCAFGVLFTEKVRNQRVHARRGEENGRVVFGDQACRRDDFMSFGSKKIKIELSERFAREFFHNILRKSGFSFRLSRCAFRYDTFAIRYLRRSRAAQNRRRYLYYNRSFLFCKSFGNRLRIFPLFAAAFF